MYMQINYQKISIRININIRQEALCNDSIFHELREMS